MDGPGHTLVGRELELATITTFLRRRQPSPAAAVIEGPAGIGKTTLWEAGVEEARRFGFRVLACRPAAAEAHLLHGGLSDLLLEHVGDTLGRLPGPQRQALEIVLLLTDPGDRQAD